MHYDLPYLDFLNKSKLQFYGDSAKHNRNLFKKMYKKCLKDYKEIYNKKTKDYSFFGPYYIHSLSLIPDLEKDVFKLSFSYKDSLIEIPMIVKTNSNSLNTEIRKNRRFYDAYKKVIRKTERSKRKAYSKVMKYIIRRANKQKKIAVKREEARQKMLFENKELLAGKPEASSIVRIFNIDNFGIYNCDLRQRMNNPTRIRKFYKGEGAPKVVVVDFDKNGLIQFDNIDRAFFDGGSKTMIILFFTKTIIGIYKSWKSVPYNTKIEFTKIDVGDMSASAVYQMIIK